MEITMGSCKRKLTILWFTGAGVLIFFVFFQMVFGRYGNNSQEAWGWLFPNIMPSLVLMAGVLFNPEYIKETKSKKVDRFVYRLSYSISAAYLIIVALTIILDALVASAPFEIMKNANFLLGPSQGLVSASLGLFFVKSKKA